MRSRIWSRPVLGAVAMAALLLGGCAAKELIIPSGPPTIGPARLTLQQIEHTTRNLADTYMLMFAEGCDRVLAATEDKRVEAQVLGLKAGTAQSTTILAIGPNPLANLIDLAATATLRRQATEEYWVPVVLGEVATPLIDAARRGEAEIWGEIAGVLTPEQMDELRAEVADWRANHPDDWYTGTTGLRNVAIERSEASGGKGPAARSIFSLLFLDPLSSLDPAAQQVELSRRFADRVMFALQRQPLILSWQAEYLLAVAGTRSTGETVLTGLAEVSESSRRFADFLDSMPALLDAQRDAAAEAIGNEREAAINSAGELMERERAAAFDDFFTRLASEREAIFRELAAEQGSIAATSAELRRTIEAAETAAATLDGAAVSVHSLLGWFDSDPNDTSEPALTTEQLIEILHSAEDVAAQLTVLADRVDGLIASPALAGRVEQSNELATVIDERLRGAIDYAYGRLLRLLLLAGVVVLVTGVILRLVSGRLGRASPRAAG